VRGNLDVSLHREIYGDLFRKLSLFDDYDSRPGDRAGDENPSNNDY